MTSFSRGYIHDLNADRGLVGLRLQLDKHPDDRTMVAVGDSFAFCHVLAFRAIAQSIMVEHNEQPTCYLGTFRLDYIVLQCV